MLSDGVDSYCYLQLVECYRPRLQLNCLSRTKSPFNNKGIVSFR